MLIEFSVKNWMSFKENTLFSMVASEEKQHQERLARFSKHKGLKVLPIASIYGGNASGKTNLFKAIAFAKNFIVNGTRPDAPILVEPFCLDDKSFNLPTEFKFQIMVIEELIYEFSFTIDREKVIEERLALVTNTSEKELYRRHDNAPHFSKSLDQNKFLHFAFQGTRDNQLFLTNAVSQKVADFAPIYNWFKDTLELVAPDSKFGEFEKFLDEGSTFYKAMNDILPSMDTGISRIGGEEISFEQLPLPDVIKKELLENVKVNRTVRVTNSRDGERFLVRRGHQGELQVKKMVSFHKNSSGDDIKFEMKNESDGTCRLIDLLPVFIDVMAKDCEKVYIIDELDRSLHTQATRTLLETYLSACSSNTRGQILLTTHDLQLMDQDLFRRDEMWVTERDDSGCSTVFSFSEYKDVRKDKDVRKSYLQGRLGGLPRISTTLNFEGVK